MLFCLVCFHLFLPDPHPDCPKPLFLCVIRSFFFSSFFFFNTVEFLPPLNLLLFRECHEFWLINVDAHTAKNCRMAKLNSNRGAIIGISLSRCSGLIDSNLPCLKPFWILQKLPLKKLAYVNDVIGIIATQCQKEKMNSKNRKYRVHSKM